jgi:hydroxymethylpyrimidine/phosphomethylpyrimidine kinase
MNANAPTPPIALSIAGSDPSGGAGIQGDLKTFSALGVYGTAVIAALTAQNTREVRAVHAPPAEFVAHQIDCVFEDLPVAATKVGMLGRREVVETVAARLRAHSARNVVVDPVMVSKSGAKLLADDAVEALRAELVPLAALLTPNLPEAAVLLGTSEGEVLVRPEDACRRLLTLGCRAVLLKGGHAGGGYSEDLYWDGERFVRLSARRAITENTHGTGCTLSSAIAAGLARGLTPVEATQRAKRYVTEALDAAKEWRLGGGHGPLDHFYELFHEARAEREDAGATR